ncbi:serine--tRNA ligase [Candidatus Parcubacteria bacterium]|jgi:seryl-tRNA synthetase|nr:MAG: serine--tRNA ligase [Candidatus Parcubacteria bacterium]
MIDYKDFLKNPEKYFLTYRNRGGETLFKQAKTTLAKIQKVYNKAAQQKLETWQAEINQASRIFPKLDAKQKKIKQQELKKLSAKIALLEKQIKEGEGIIDELIGNLPNLIFNDVPLGPDASNNEVVKIVGAKPKFAKPPKDYLSLAEKLDLIDIPRAAKVSGSRFGYLKGDAVLLEFALIQYTLETLMQNGFLPILPPVIIKQEYMEAMGYLAQGGEAEVYNLPKDNQYLIGTSEQSVGPYYAGEILTAKDLPKKFLAFSTCFRREAGSYGKDTKGILRVHQFDKLEMFVFSAPENSEHEHQKLLQAQEALVQGLNLPYRVVKLCSGDLGFPSAKTFDIECWLPGQNQGQGEYRETHSTSNTTDFQARALNMRYQPATGKKEFVHLLNGTAFAIGRILIAILENYQQPDGSIEIPKNLRKHLGQRQSITKSQN